MIGRRRKKYFLHERKIKVIEEHIQDLDQKSLNEDLNHCKVKGRNHETASTFLRF